MHTRGAVVPRSRGWEEKGEKRRRGRERDRREEMNL
jgi:hypothetical protein